MGSGKQRVWAEEPSGTPSAAVLLVRLGRPGASVWIDAWCAGAQQPGAVDEMFDALERPVRVPKNAPPCNGRAYVEELGDCLGHLGRTQPEAFIDRVAERPALRDRYDVISVLGRIDDPRVVPWLREALRGRDGFSRWIALNALLGRHDPDAIAHLSALLRDRDHLVRFDAADGLRRWGGMDDVPALLAYADKAQIGGRERAMDAIEMICERAAAPLPEAHPGRRLTIVAAPPGARLRDEIMTALMVDRGTPLADVGDEPVLAPRGGVIAGLDFDARGQLEQIVIRRDERARGA